MTNYNFGKAPTKKAKKPVYKPLPNTKRAERKAVLESIYQQRREAFAKMMRKLRKVL